MSTDEKYVAGIIVDDGLLLPLLECELPKDKQKAAECIHTMWIRAANKITQRVEKLWIRIPNKSVCVTEDSFYESLASIDPDEFVKKLM